MQSKDYDVACLGILVADMFASPLPEVPKAGELRVVDEIYPDTGGCAANTGVSLVKLGARVGLMGKVGDDIFGEFIIKDMTAKGLDASGVKVSETMPTSKTMIIPVIGQDRRFIHVIGANADLAYEDVDLDMVARSRAIYVGGFLVQPKLDQKALAELFRFAKQKGLITVLDVIVPMGGGIRYEVAETVAEVLPYTDTFLPNDDEARLLTHKDDPVEQAEVFLDHGCKTVVITMGERGAVLRTKDLTLRAPAFQVDVVDPSGAGDAFDAGFIWGLLQGWDPRRTLEFAAALGASACMKLGCTPGVFTMDEALAFLERHKLDIQVLTP